MQKSRITASAFYVLYYGAAGALLPFLPLFYRELGLDGTQIGMLAALLTIATVVAGPLWGAFADAYRLHARLLPLAMLATIPPALAMTGVDQFWVLAALILVLAVMLTPIVPLADNAVLALLGDRRHGYGALRVWGAVGWGIAAWLAGLLAEDYGVRIVFWMFGALMALAAVAGWRLRAPSASSDVQFLAGLRQLATNPAWLGFMASVVVFGTCYAAINTFLALHLEDLGATQSLFGFSVAVAGVSELPVFLGSALMLRRVSPRGMILIAFGALMLRCAATALIADPRWILPIQLLHGLSFSAMWVAGVRYAADLAPSALGASAQALFNAGILGLGGAIGSIGGGRIYAAAGGAALFGVAAGLALVGLLLFALFQRRAARVSHYSSG